VRRETVIIRWTMGRPILRHLLRRHSAQGESEHVAAGQAQRIQEIERMHCHSRHRRRHRAGGPTYACAIEQNDFSI
jgi:hypothetical protein